MADRTLFSRLQKLFSSDVIVRNIGGKKLKVSDTMHIQSSGGLETNFLVDKFTKLHSAFKPLGGQGGYGGSGYGRGVAGPYIASRMELLADYDSMDTDPIVASALDIISDECTVRNEYGYSLAIKTENDKIMSVLKNLFYDVLNIEFNLWSWIRGMAKYGDFYLKLDISEKYGVINVHPISTYEILREEGMDALNPSAVQFRVQNAAYVQTRIGPNAPIYQNYEIAHFRLLGDSNFLPYGRSSIEPARKIWKQLILMEDAMLIHRIMRAPEKRIFKIDIGNIPPAQVDEYMRQVMDKMKKAPYINNQTGDYNLKYNMMNITEDFYLPVRAGDSATSIETTKGLEFNAIEDIEYLKGKLLSALKIPKAFLGFDEKVGGKATLAAEDVRFARTIERVQRIVESELYKIAIVHLYAQGFTDAELVDFSIQLTNPSTIYEQEKLALLETKIKIANDLKEANLLSTDWIYKNIFNLSNDEKDDQREEVADDVRRRFKIKQMEEEGNDPEKTGRSFGTPHDLATMNIMGREQSMKTNTKMGDVKTADGDKIEFGSTNIRRNEKGGSKTLGMRYGQDSHPRGRDPLGQDNYFDTIQNTDLGHGTSYKPNYTNRSPFPMESFNTLINELKLGKTKQVITESLNIKEEQAEPKMLDESNLDLTKKIE